MDNPYQSSAEPSDKEPPRPSGGARAAVRSACRFAIPLMAIGWGAVWFECYAGMRLRYSPVLAFVSAGLRSFSFAGLCLAIWLASAAVVGAFRE